MRGVYLSVRKCEELFQEVLRGRGNLLVYSRLADATVARLYARLRRSRPTLPPSDLELICESGFIKAALKFQEFESWLQVYVYALRVARSLRRRLGEKRPLTITPIEDSADPADPASLRDAIRTDCRDLLLLYAQGLAVDTVGVLLGMARSLLGGADRHLFPRPSTRTERRKRAALKEHARKLITQQS